MKKYGFINLVVILTLCFQLSSCTNEAEEKKKEAIVFLEQRGIFNYEKELMIAAREGDTELMRLLIAAGANPHIKNNKGKTPVEVARGKCKEIPEMMAQ